MLRTFLKTLVSPRYKVFVAIFAVSLALYLAGMYHVGSILWGDTRYYYSYTRSLIMDRDINFSNEAYLPTVGFPNPPEVSPTTNLVTNKFSPGSPLLWIPGFLVGQGLTEVVYFLGANVRTDGFGILTLLTTATWALGFSVAGLYVVFRTVSERAGATIAWWVTAFTFLATQMLYYTAVDPLNSHSASFLFSAILLWGTQKYLLEKKSYSWIVLLGVVGGILSLIRNQDAVLMLPVGVLLLVQSGTVMQRVLRGVALSFGWISMMSVQVLTTLYLYGQLNSPYLIQGEQIMWLRPDFWRVLFTPQNGVLFFAPGLVLAITGLLWKFSRSDILGRVCLAAFLLELYVIAAWSPEILGGPYGSRMFVSSLPWLAVGLANLFQIWKKEKVATWKIGVILAMLTANNLLQTLYMLATH